jgi:demethylmenaquinone methyltransferase/2-methoxy-6-polyprenyl-1,4-benzoquinol methylase
LAFFIIIIIMSHKKCIGNKLMTREILNKNNINELFDNISKSYDFLNHLLTLNIDKKWRKRAIKLIDDKKSIVLDIATGTCDLAIEIINQEKSQEVFGVDFSSKMLEIGEKKIKERNLEKRIKLFEEDSCKLSFEDNTFDAVTVGFGVRNFYDLDSGLKQMLRVLKPNGELVILEFSLPKNKIIRKVYEFYFLNILPRIGKMVSKNNKAYTYLPKSVEKFIYGEEFKKKLIEIGFIDVEIHPQTFGIATIYKARKG